MGILLMMVFIVLASMLVQALFAGYETGFISTNSIRIRHIAESEDSSRARSLLRHRDEPGKMITTLLIGTSLAIVAGPIALINEFQEFNIPPQYHEALATVIVTPLFLVFSEIVPKSIFRLHPNRLSLALLPVIKVFYVVLYPLTWPISTTTTLLLRAAGGREKNISPLMSTLEDVRVLVDESAEHGAIQEEEQRMIHSVIDLGTKQAKEIMTPRINIDAVPDSATRDELIDLFEKSGRTRAPVYHESIDEIVGVVNAYDLLMDLNRESQDISRFIRPLIHVPDTMKVDDLLRHMKLKKQHMAIVTDEYGGTDGLITIEDVLEEIFGEIQDEHDREQSPIHQIGPRAYKVDARASLSEVSDKVGLPLLDDEVDTVGGWVMRIAGRIPSQGEVIEVEGFRVTILEGGTNHVSSIRLELLEQPEATHAPEN
jgi:putative hemolysin